MMLTGLIFKAGGGWAAHCDIAGVWTQGMTRKEAVENLAEAVELRVDRQGFKATVTKLGAPGDEAVLIEPSEPGLLAAAILKYQRQRNRLSLADIERALGPANRRSYASYEQGQSEPSLSKFRELLAAVAPDMVLTVGPRVVTSGAKRKSLAKSFLRRRAAAELRSAGRGRTRTKASRG